MPARDPRPWLLDMLDAIVHTIVTRQLEPLEGAIRRMLAALPSVDEV